MLDELSSFHTLWMGAIVLNRKILGLAIAGASLAFANASYAAFDLSNCDGFGTACPYVTYGDGNSYALPVNALIYDAAQGGGTGPGNPFYVVSTPGAIKDLTVVATGASGTPVNTNYTGSDNAYPTPNGTGAPDYFSTGTVADPGGAGEFTGDVSQTWDVTLAALAAFLSGDSPVFFFNNNQVNSGASTNQNLAAWAQLTVTDSTGAIVKDTFGNDAIYDFTNEGGKYAGIADGGGGVPLGDPTAYTHTGALDNPLVGTNAATDYVLSGGLLCTNAGLLVSCSAPHDTEINLNLGANQAAYAIVFPELNALLASLNGAAGYTLHVDLRFGCDPAVVDKTTDCVARSLNNGYEQVFISSATSVINFPVPEPGMLALLAISFIGLGWTTMRARNTH
jgi:hypothetical protein